MSKEPEKFEITTEELDLVSGGLGWDLQTNSLGKPATPVPTHPSTTSGPTRTWNITANVTV